VRPCREKSHATIIWSRRVSLFLATCEVRLRRICVGRFQRPNPPNVRLSNVQVVVLVANSSMVVLSSMIVLVSSLI
jgi:hypothetical protein